MAIFHSACLSVVLSQKYTPEHPVVQELVNRGLAYLERNAGKAGTYGEGETILVGYCAFKVTSDPNHQLVRLGVDAARKVAQATANTRYQAEEKSVYVLSVAGMLLPTVDVDANGNFAKLIRDYLIRAQKPHGGFGYPSGSLAQSGDISQTQYAMLCFWTMNQSGIEVPNDTIERTINFLMAAQDNAGGWPYQYPSQATQNPPSNSLTAAGLSALLMGGDTLGLYRSKHKESQDEEGIIPAAFRRIVATDGKRIEINVDRSRVESVTKRSENWFAMNPYTRDINFHYYYVYSKERYESFLEITRGKQVKSPPWYVDGVELLKEAQAPDGSWGSKPGETTTFLSPAVSTAFSILFLLRSTQKAIGDLSEAFNVGIGDLPDDVTSIATRGGRIISKNATTSIDDALIMLEDDKATEGEESLAPDRMLLDKDPKRRQEQLSRFVRLLNAKDFNARRIAAKMLGRGDSLDFIPPLIYALTDPDPRIPHYAENSLRLISRQLDTRHLPQNVPLTQTDRARAAEQWKKWFLTIRPDYVFVD
ncbi:MAG: hypothetical protein ABL921_32190 [Pirellula sp.]